MSNIKQLINKSLENPKYLSYWLNTLIEEHISEVKASLKEPMVWERNPYLIQDIKATLHHIHSKPHWLKQLFYTLFNIETKQNFYKKLSILLDQIHTDKHIIENEYKDNQKNHQKVSKILESLKILYIEFEKEKSTSFCLNEINDKISLIKTYHITLLLREKNLLEIQILYKRIEEWKV